MSDFNVLEVMLCACRFMLDLKPEQMQEYMKKITSMAVSAGCKVC